MDYGERKQTLLLHFSRDWVALESNNIVRIPRRIGERTFPQSLIIDWLFPCAMVALVDNSLQRDTRVLHRPHVTAQMHKQIGIRR